MEERYRELLNKIIYSMNDGQIQALGALVLGRNVDVLCAFEDELTHALHDMECMLREKEANTEMLPFQRKSLKAEIEFVRELYDGGIDWAEHDLEHELPMKLNRKTLPNHSD